MKFYLYAIRNYAVFAGRTSRQACVWFVVFHVLFVAIISALERRFAIAEPEILFGRITAAYLLLTFVPLLSLSVRRLHDLDRTGWWTLLYAIPFFGFALLFFLIAAGGTSETNRYGPAMVAVANAEVPLSGNRGEA